MDIAALFEMDWYDKSPMTAVLQRNRGRWIHFSQGAPNRDYRTAKLLPEPARPDSYQYRTAKRYQRDLAAVKRKNAIEKVPKMGINPRSIWRDPKGVYFYPVNWLLSGAERVSIGQQHGINYRYYYIVELNFNDPNGINLGTMTWQDVEAIARRNGWLEQMQEFRQESVEQQKDKLFSYSRPDLPGSFFWHFIDRMVKDEQMTWTKAYKGVSYIYDPNLSIIHSNEPHQVLVLDPRIIKVIEFGENKQPVNFSDTDKVEHWMHALLTIMKRVRGEFGGDWTWEKKKPTLSFAKGSGKFKLTLPTRSGGTMDVGLTLSYTYGRAYDLLYFKYEMLTKMSVEEIFQSIVARVEQVAKMKSDLLFTPVISIEAGKQLMLRQMMNNVGLSISTTIYNSNQTNYNSVSMHGEVQREVNQVNLKTTCYLSLHQDYLSGGCNVWAGKHYMISAQSPYDEKTSDPAVMAAAMAAKMRENLLGIVRAFAPGRTYNYSHPAFHYPEQVPAFIGWLAVNSGLNLNGEIKKQFAEEIAAYETYPEKRALLADIAYVMNSKW